MSVACGDSESKEKLFFDCLTTMYQLHSPFVVNCSYIRVVIDIHYGEIQMKVAVAYLRAFLVDGKLTKVTALCPRCVMAST